MTSSISYSAIHTFTVVAQQLSFTRAAEVLHITPSAVSHQMKLLESQMGITLFVRQSKGVSLTLAGKALFGHALSGIKNIQHGITQSQFASQKEKLVIAVIPSLCQLWLIPRLMDFCDSHPHIELELVAVDQLVDFNTSTFDGHIHFGAGDYRIHQALFLSSEVVYPVCHPDLLTSNESNNVGEIIRNNRLLNYKAGVEDEPGGVSWIDWFNFFSIEKPFHLNQMWFSHVAMATTAAKQKQGVVLGWHRMVQDDIAQGLLSRMTEHNIQTSYSYYLVAPQRSWRTKSFNTFSAWLAKQFSI